MLLDIGLRVVSTLLIALGAFLLLFGLLDFSPGHRLQSVVILILAPIAVFGFLRVGGAILRDLRQDGPKEQTPDREDPEEGARRPWRDDGR